MLKKLSSYRIIKTSNKNLCIMERERLFILLSIIILFSACIGSKTAPRVKSSSDSEIMAFKKAESLFQQQRYKSALPYYSHYISQYPKGLSADIALKKIATIHGYLGDIDAKLDSYRRLSKEYPDSPYAPEANYEILETLHKEGRSKEAILRASSIIKSSNNKHLLLGTYTILGDTYSLLNSPADAIFFYNLAYLQANSSEKENIINKVKSVINLLNSDDLAMLFKQLEHEQIKSELQYLVALREYESGNYAKAKNAFLEFIESYPYHKSTENAEILLAEIHQRTTFRNRLIGCMLPLSGRYESFGKRALKAIQLAIDHFNVGKGQNKLQLIIMDTGSEEKTIARLVKTLDKRGVAVIIGPMATSKKAAEEAQKRKIPIITLTQRTGIPEIGEYVFRNFLTPDAQVDALLECAIEKFGTERFAILYPDEIYGQTFAKTFWEKAEYYGADVAYIASYSPDQTDFSAAIKKMARITENQGKGISAPHRQLIEDKSERKKKDSARLDFDAIFIPDQASKIALIAPQLAFWDVDNVLLIGTNLWHSDQLIAMTKDYIQGAILTDVFHSHSKKKPVQHFIRSFDELHNRRPGFIEALAYDTAMIAFQNAANDNMRSRKELKDQLLKTLNYEGITGLTSFKFNGEAQKKLYMLQIRGANFIELN
jgi:ABC-type branched-subunit amino acid transport system substrate-binding protein/TolA-binding protein